MTQNLILSVTLVAIVRAQSPPNPPQFVPLNTNFDRVVLHSDGQTAWATGGGFIYRSTDGGANWTWIDTPGNGRLDGLYFLADGNHGWAVGESRILYTGDGGLTWSNASGVPASRLRDVIFDSEGKRGFAVGWNDMILATDDGGVSWKRIAAGISPDSGGQSNGFNVIAFDGGWKVGLIGGSDALLKSEDGGRTWRQQPGVIQRIGQSSALTPVKAVWVSSDGRTSAVISEADVHGLKMESLWFRDAGAGQGWTADRDEFIGHPIVVFREGEAIAAGAEGIFLRKREGGTLRRVFEGEYSGLALAAGGRRGLAVGKLGRVARTDDGGMTWRVIHESQVIGLLLRVVLQPYPERVWAVGSRVFRSDDGGRSFSEVKLSTALAAKSPEALEARDLKFSSDGRMGWMATKGTIFRTTDGGETWTPAVMLPATDDLILGVAFDRDGRRGIAVDYTGVLTTGDGGEHWVRVQSPARLRDVCFAADGRTAWAVGTGGRIYRSDDGGTSWKAVPSQTRYDLWRVVFRADGRLGWAAGHSRTILRTENGGRTWTAAVVNTTAPVDVSSVWFDADGRYGWAVTTDQAGVSIVLRSVDSGRTWDPVDAPYADYRDIAMTPDGRRGWAAGNNIMRTLHSTQAPQITKFEVSTPDFLLELAADDPDTPKAGLRGVIDVEGRGLEFQADNVRRSFGISDVDTVAWPKSLFQEREPYVFHLRLTDGWNVVTRDFRIGSPAAPLSSELKPAPIVPLDLTELRNLNLAGAHVFVDGREIDAVQIITRGSDGNVSLTPAGSVLNSLTDGFHALTIARGSQEVLKRIGFYKEQLTLKLFRPYDKSYALIIAVGDYPPESGYRKLPNAEPQARELEKALREQGFTVLAPLYGRDATRARIETAIRTVPAGPEDRLFVYFGGHGDDEKGFQGKPVGYLVPYDGRKSDLWGTAIPLEKIAGEYSARLRAKHVLFTLDSCQSGLAISRGSPLGLNAEELRRFKALAEIETLSSEPGRTILTAGTGGQDALDVSGGLFTTALMDGIRGKADADHNGVVDYFELFAYVWGRVNAEARQWIRKQQPADYQLGNGRWVFVYH